jgi:hypothetical protein
MWFSSKQISILLSEPVQQHLRHHKFHNNEEVEMAIHEWLQMHQAQFVLQRTTLILVAT